MKVKITGTVLEITQELDERDRKLATVTALIYQKGVKMNTAVKRIPMNIVAEGQLIQDLPITIREWKMNDRSGISCTFDEETANAANYEQPAPQIHSA